MAKDWRVETLLFALEELVKLQAHYARLLNQWDGGRRHAFASAQEWLDKLASMEAPPQVEVMNPEGFADPADPGKSGLEAFPKEPEGWKPS